MELGSSIWYDVVKQEQLTPARRLPMDILSRVAKGMQGVLTKSADIIGRETGFIKRLRKLSGSGFVQTLVFGWLSNPDSTVEELCQIAATLGIDITGIMQVCKNAIIERVYIIFWVQHIRLLIQQ